MVVIVVVTGVSILVFGFVCSICYTRVQLVNQC